MKAPRHTCSQQIHWEHACLGVCKGDSVTLRMLTDSNVDAIRLGVYVSIVVHTPWLYASVCSLYVSIFGLELCVCFQKGWNYTHQKEIIYTEYLYPFILYDVYYYKLLLLLFLVMGAINSVYLLHQPLLISRALLGEAPPTPPSMRPC